MRNSVFKNAAWLAVSGLAVRVLTTAATILLARNLGAEEYGSVSLGLSLSVIFMFCADLGVTHTFIREATKPGADMARLARAALKLRFVLALIASLVAVSVIAVAYRHSAFILILYAVVIPSIWGGALDAFCSAYYQALENMQYITIVRTISGIVQAGMVLAGILWHWQIAYIGLAFGVSSILAGGIGLVLVFKDLTGSGGWEPALVRGIGSFALSGVLGMLLPQLGPLILEKVNGLTAVGYFSVAYRFPGVLYQLPSLLAAAFYPRLFYTGSHDPEGHWRLSIKELHFMSLLGFILALPFALYAGPIIALLFGSAWAAVAARPLSILAWVVTLQSINYPLADALTTQGLQRRRAGVLVIVMIIGTLGCAILGFIWGATGAALSSVLVEALLVVGFASVNPRGWTLLWHGLSGAIPTYVVAGVGSILFSYFTSSPLVGCLGTGLLFLITVFSTDKETRAEIHSLLMKRREGAGDESSYSFSDHPGI